MLWESSGRSVNGRRREWSRQQHFETFEMLNRQESQERQVFAPPPPTVLIADDDPNMRVLLSDLLRKNGYHVVSAADGHQARTSALAGGVDLVLLDVMLPGMSGFDVCRELHRTSESGPAIIMISARGEEADRVTGLELGADDYISKPFSRSELLARVRAVLRRGAPRHSASRTRPSRYHFAGWRVELRRREVFAASGVRVDLSGAEYDLLIRLLENPQRVISREALLEMARTRLGSPSDRSIDVLISRLRQKLEGDEGVELIRTVRSVGYMFVPDVEHS
ncbi:response regulator transcription factor [Phenylobacterium sp.]|uniref:response regulator transcription factor n=1 Tax=Phenylobacterium sp. TaxID=1871053 RepID=UPI0028A0F7A8|nr:response regulator transcription factor [Phenylobacterium sp.]